MNRYDTNIMVYQNSMAFAKESARSYIILARNAKRRGDACSWLDCYNKARYHRITMHYWAKVIREYPKMLKSLGG